MAIDIIPGVGPQNSDIAAAVAAPSAATIASTVASSVPTLGQITSTVQANAGSPFGGTWTNLGSVNFNGASATISGLNSYKYLRFSVWSYHLTLTNDVYFRINGDSGSNYFSISSINEGYNNHAGLQASGQPNGSLFQIGNASVADSANFIGTVEIFGAQSGAYKTIKGTSVYRETNYNYFASYSLDATWKNTSAVSSFTVYNSRTSGVGGTVWVQGAN